MTKEYRKFLFQTRGDPSVGIGSDEVSVTVPDFDRLDSESQLAFLSGIRDFVHNFYDDRVIIYDVTDDKADPKPISLGRVPAGAAHLG